MKKILLTAALASALVANVCSANMGTIVAGAAPTKNTTNSKSPYNPAVNLLNNDTVPVFITAFEEPGDIPWLTYEALPPGMFNTPFNYPYTYLNLQASCYPNGPAVIGGNFADGQTFVIPYGICSLSKAKKK